MQKVGFLKVYGKQHLAIKRNPDVPSSVLSNVPSNVPSQFWIFGNLGIVFVDMSETQLNKASKVVMALCEREVLSMPELMLFAGESNRSRFRQNIMTPLIQKRLCDTYICRKSE